MDKEWTHGKSVIEVDWSIEGELTQEYRELIGAVIMDGNDYLMKNMLAIREFKTIDPSVFSTSFTTEKKYAKQVKRMNSQLTKFRSKRFAKHFIKKHNDFS